MSEERIYYSPRGAGVWTVSPGRIEEVDGLKTRLGAKAIQFAPMGSYMPDPENPKDQMPPYGSYRTSDPDCIAFIERLRAEQKAAGVEPDILTADEFHTRVVPKAMQINQLRERNLELQSQLAKVLAEQQKIPGGSQQSGMRTNR